VLENRGGNRKSLHRDTGSSELPSPTLRPTALPGESFQRGGLATRRLCFRLTYSSFLFRDRVQLFFE